MKRGGPLNKKSKSASAIIQDRVWDLCRKITFKVHGTNCYTCSQRNLVGRNCHCGHMWPKGAAGALLKYNLDILRPQCYQCNMNYGGRGAVFLEKMAKEVGPEKMQKLFDLKLQDSKGQTRATEHYLMLLEKYHELWEEIKNK